jgi:uncharacterized LabA/DUF88 family protein
MYNPGPKPPKNYLFIDGGYFRKYLEFLSTRYFKSQEIIFKYENFKPEFEKVFYYDCLPAKKSNEAKSEYETRLQEQINFFSKLRMIDGFHVYEGSMSGKDGKARQKQVDIMISVHMLSHTIRGNMEKTTLIAGDLDFKPLIDELIREGMYVTLMFDKRSANEELIYAADARKKLLLSYIIENSNMAKRKNNNIPEKIESNRLNGQLTKYKMTNSGLSKGYKKTCLYFNEENSNYIVTLSRDNLYSTGYKHEDLKHLLNYLADIGIETSGL